MGQKDNTDGQTNGGQTDGWMDEQCMDIKVLIKNGWTQKTPTRAAVEVKMLQKRVKG